LEGADWAWDPVQSVQQLVEDSQFIANEYLVPIHTSDGTVAKVVASPVQFDGQAAEPTESPTSLGGYTDDALLQAGYTWDELIELKISGGIL
jgi:crotonobetainyl-CoA:carnitine CoA-transferase CaiB-like acyl-CoA transferase